MTEESSLTADFIHHFTAWTGLEVTARRDTFNRCLRDRAAQRKFPSLAAYLTSISGPEDAEIGRLVDALMIGYSWLFRDVAQMSLIIDLLSERPSRTTRARIWVAGCATGEDVYTLALLAGKQPLDILGTDVNQHALEIARTGRYHTGALRVVPNEYQRFFQRRGDALQIDESLRQGVRFAAHNLMDPAPTPPRGASWDVIVCRNVLIHFAPAQRLVAFRHLSAALPPGGFLLLGAGETAPVMPDLQRMDRDGYCVLQRSIAPPTVIPNEPPPSVSLPVVPPPILPPLPAPESASTTLPLLQIASAQLQRSQFTAAITTCRSVLQHDRFCVEALLLSGVAWGLGGRDGEAIVDLQQALFLRPELWPAAFYLALSLERIGQLAAACAAYQWVTRESQKPHCDEQTVLLLLGITAWRTELVRAAKVRAQQLEFSATHS